MVSFVLGATVIVGLFVIGAVAPGAVLAALYRCTTTGEIPEVFAGIGIQNRGIERAEDDDLSESYTPFERTAG